jgi:cell division protein FtsI (penicillin-binding protein 3)
MRLVDRRIGLLFAVFFLLLLVAAGRAAWLGGVRAGDLRERAQAQQEDELVLHGRRGTITDRGGVELAVSEDAATVFANPFLIENPLLVAAKLAEVLGRPEQELLDLLADQDAGFVYLARQVDADVGRTVERLRIEGVGTVEEPKRRYPQGALAAQVLGAVGTDGYGLGGLEQSLEDELHGADGHRLVVSDALGDPVSIVETERAEAGEDVQLTLDSALQKRVEEALAEVGATWAPQGAHAIAVDPETGAVLALANWPAVDSDDWADAPGRVRRNSAVSSSFEPGSTFKPFVVAGALEENLVEPESSFTLEPSIEVGGDVIADAEVRPTETFTVGDILARSSNVGMVTIGQKLGPERLDGWVRAFGFGEATGLGLPGEPEGIVPSPDDYTDWTLANLPIGQGLSVPPVQMVRGFTAIANGGVMHSPYLLADAPSSGERVISEETARQVARMLRAVVEEGGTAEDTAIPGYRLAGKTGTAEKEVGGDYSTTEFYSSFIGFAPARDPQLLVAVGVDEPAGGAPGARAAAPAVEDILEFALPRLGIAPR